MNCSRCGTILADNAAFCPQCGNPNPAAPPPVQENYNYSPQSVYAPPPKISDYLIWSILLTICCCPLCGIPAIIFSVLSKSALAEGRFDVAAKHSKTAFTLNIIGLILSIFVNVLVIVGKIILLQQNGGDIMINFGQ